MIIDDNRMIIGSANINDRSLHGSRDSELAMYIEGFENGVVHFEGKKICVNHEIHTFRKRLMNEYFAISEPYTIWPVSEQFWSRAWNTMKINTQIYDIAFKVIPSNCYLNWSMTQSRNKTPNKKAFKDLKHMIKGLAVQYPYQFLINEDLEDARNESFALLLVPLKTLQ
jgi:phospholipase D1/2